ncbi:three-Cys-motif partner protein TcmP [Streptomyces iakyrus]|uniref:three-Cys-motif partner protein TcmP n=1 Tax=Streptomyces iakyrus TaxID=68219 RepID=UPI0036C64BB0
MYAEGFAGAGIYKQGEPGSPVIAYEVFADALHRFPKRMRVILMEEDARRVKELQRQMELVRSRQTDDITRRIAVAVHHGDFHPALLQKLRGIGALGKPLFVLLDSFGGPDIPFSLLQELGRYPSTEVMVTFEPSFLTRFAEKHDGHRQLGDEAFGSPEWQGVFQQSPSGKFTPDTAPLRRILHDFISEAPDGRTIPELKRYALLETVYRPAQVIEAVRQLREAGAVTTEPRAINTKTRVSLAATPPTTRPSAEQGALW